MSGGFVHNNLAMIVATLLAVVAIGIWWWIRKRNE